MCGIVGVVHLEGKCISDHLVRRMAEIISHRGPDDEGFYFDDHIELGFKRLSIIDLKTGHQPIFNEDFSKVIIFNGEIYNYKEIRLDLEKRGHIFTTNTDTEVILHAYEEKSFKCLDLLNGMFAFAIWDLENKMLFIARDRLGIKPLYYYQGSNNFVFTSELKALLDIEKLEDINKYAIHDYLTLRYPPAPSSIISGVKKLLPGHYLFIKNKNVQIKKYWDLNFTIKIKDRERNVKKKFWELFLDAVSLRLRSDVPVGLFLSGGVDSSAVAVAMSDLGIKDIKTFSIGFDTGPEYEEFAYAGRIAEKFKTDHHIKIIGSNDFFAVLPKVIWHLDEPVADSATIPLYLIAQMAKKYVTVILSGEGGDEILAGYKKSYYSFYRWQIIKNYLNHLPIKFTNPQLLKICQTINNNLFRFLNFINRPVSEDDILPISLTMSEEEKEQLYSKKIIEIVKNHKTLDMFRQFQKDLETGDYLDRKLYIDIKSWLPDDLLTKADRATMAHGLELRVPFLDYRLVEFAASLPNRFRVKKGEGKYLLKRILEDRIPNDILYRKKMGFPVPVYQWFSKGNIGHKIAMNLLLSPRTLERDIFDRRKLAILVKEAYHPVYLWYIFVLEIWYRLFIDKERAEDITLL